MVGVLGLCDVYLTIVIFISRLNGTSIIEPQGRIPSAKIMHLLRNLNSRSADYESAALPG